MRVSFLTLLLSLLGLSSATFAQSDEQCAAEAVHFAEVASSTTYARNFDAVRDAVQRLQTESNRNMDVYTLPVVVHVIHRGSPVGVNENISDEQILSGIEDMNERFRKEPGTLGDGNGVNTYIQFEMAKRTPEGEPTNGIVRVNGNSVPGFAEHGISNGNDQDAGDQMAVKALTTWFGDDYINIFVVPEINGNDGGWGIQGFAYLGPTGDARDGVTVLYNTFGTVGELKSGRDLNTTVTHEMGHHLSLWHTFSNTTSCTSETNCENQGDEVCDTPATVTNDLGCFQPVCEGAQVENYMDYTEESCRNTFSEGQRTRMRGCLESVRSSLLESLGGLPVTERDLTVTGFSNVGASTCTPSVAPIAVVTNFGVIAVDGFELTTQLNSNNAFTTIHQESVAPGESIEVMLPELALAADTNELNVTVALLGGDADDFGGNDAYTQRFELAASDYWTMTLNTDNWANEISWRIEDADGEIIMDGGGYSLGSNTYVEQGCVPVGCHTLIMEDTNGDGLCAMDFGNDGVCDFGGSMTLTDASGSVLVALDNTNNDYGYEGIWEVCANEASTVDGCADENVNGICDSAEISGCQDVNACNFTPGAILDNGSCTYAETHYDCNGNCLEDTDGDGICNPLETEGCTDSAACNYIPSASDNDGSCEYTTCAGCTDVSGCNYDSSATISSGCDYPDPGYNCQGECLNDSDGDGVCDEFEIPGCDDDTACNYDSSATDNDESCTFPETYYACDETCLNDTDGDGVCDPLEVEGCQDAEACNYNTDATDSGNCDYPQTYYTCDGSCVADSDGDGICDELEIPGCDDSSACNFDSSATDNNGSCEYPAEFYACDGCINDADFDGVCDELEIPGCMAMGANNFDVDATDDDGSCEYDTFGCTDETACNYNPMATEDTGNCTYNETYYECNGTCTNDVDGDGVCDQLEVAGCDDAAACNFSAEATDNDGSCEYSAEYYNCEGNCVADTDGDGVCDELEIAGCDDSAACNYDAAATDNNGSCTFAAEYYDCEGNCLNDGDGDGICDEAELAGCTDETACNFSEEATDDDGSCEYPAPGEDCETDNVGDFNVAPALNLFPNPMSPEHSMVYLSGLDNDQTPIRVLASDGRVAWQGTGIVTSPGVVGYPIRESISPGTYFIQVGTSTPSGNIPLMVW